MPPVPIYAKSPINAAKASGVSPKTGLPTDDRASDPPAVTTASGSLAAAQPPPPPPARPGAVPSLPQPSGVPQSAIGSGGNPSQLVRPTPTTKTADHGPPPPQPGAVPLPPGSDPPTTTRAYPQQPQQTATSALPAYAPHASTAGSGSSSNTTSATTMPPQIAVPPLTSGPHAYPVSRGTATTTQATQGSGWSSFPQPTGLAYGSAQQQQHNLDHPPGYVQNASAAEVNSSQRTAAQLASVEEATFINNNNQSNRALYGGQGQKRGEGGEEGVWDAAKKFALAAGERLSAAENEVWRRINKGQ
ncbi:hypothetical protein SPI_06659 [Niveomyces insectorum RCEF 264]|uniref:Uncharacterized protein n=1 Tax=Niveomyces insectorum RCEF 264 TaxID=1081102 RepID=A0A167RH08_9HYPO|nr:hypothetical protein SPI_06659 [Niveomyces insectorum RCEF 264]